MTIPEWKETPATDVTTVRDALRRKNERLKDSEEKTRQRKFEEEEQL